MYVDDVLMGSQGVGRFYENVKFLSQFCTPKLECSIKFDEKLLEVNRLSFRLLPSKSPLSFSVTEIVALTDKLLSAKKNQKW